MPFHYVLTNTLTSGAFTQFLTPALFPRVNTEADAWAHFRVKKLQVRLHRASTLNGPMSVGYMGGVQDNLPASVYGATETLPSTFMSPVTTVPTDWVHVPKVDLAGPFPWYKTVAGAADATEESPGIFFVMGTSSDTFYAEFRGTFEFKTSLATANTPIALQMRTAVREERLKRVLETERALLLRILATTPGSSAGGLSLVPKASV